MKSSIFAVVPVGMFMLSAVGCAVAAGPEEQAVVAESEAVTACPKTSASDDQMRASATVALNLMKDASLVASTWSNKITEYSILAPQRYRVQSSGTGIEFDPNDTIYYTVNNAMKAHLAFAQLDSSVAKFLSDGLKYAYANTDGLVFAKIITTPVLETFKYPKSVTISIQDPTSSDNSHYATVSGSAWCGASVVTISDTVSNSWQYAPIYSDSIHLWRGTTPPEFTGTKQIPWAPFNGSVSSGNPYLIVSISGKATNWATYDFKPVTCYDYPNFKCSGTVEIDPVPYAEPGDYYNTTGIVGTQANPFALTSTVLYASPDHQQQWATRTTNGVQEWGTFSSQVTLFGSTMFKYVKKM